MCGAVLRRWGECRAWYRCRLSAAACAESAVGVAVTLLVHCGARAALAVAECRILAVVLLCVGVEAALALPVAEAVVVRSLLAVAECDAVAVAEVAPVEAIAHSEVFVSGFRAEIAAVIPRPSAVHSP